MIYVFQCKNDKCKHMSEVTLSLKEFEAWKAGKLRVACTKCDSQKLVNVVTTVPVHFKGNGFTKGSR